MKQKPITVFLCHSSDDKPAVRSLYARLKSDGISPWLDEEDLRPGENWRTAITKAVRAADIVLVCLSKTSIAKTGYVQKEITYALDRAEEQPEGQIYLIPVRLEPCPVPERLSHWQWVDLYSDRGYEKLLSSLALLRGSDASHDGGWTPFTGVVQGKEGLVLCERCERFYDPNDKSFSCSHHAEPPTIIGNTGPVGDYADVWRFPCCAKTVVGAISERGNDIKPPMSPGCCTSMHVAYEA